MVETQKIKQSHILFAFLKIGLLGFGGGAATIPLFHKEVVDKNHWLTENEFSDMLAIMNTLPGPMQTKMAGYIGYRVKGIFGIFSGLLGIILPSLLLMIVAFQFLAEFKNEAWVRGLTLGVLPVVGVMMGALTWQFFTKSQKSLGLKPSILLGLISFILLFFLDLHPVFIIIPLLFLALFKPQSKLSAISYGVIGFLLLGLYTLYLTVDMPFDFPTFSFGLENGGPIATYLQLFLAFLIPGLIGYGGGPASIPLFEYEVVHRYSWLTVEGFGELVAIGNVLPGVVATKISGYIGWQQGNLLDLGTISGIIGIFVTLFAMVAPSLILLILLLNILNKYKDSPRVKRLTNYVRPTIGVLLGLLAYRFFKSAYHDIGWLQTGLLIVVSYTLLQKLKVHPIFVITGAIVYGALILGLFGSIFIL